MNTNRLIPSLIILLVFILLTTALRPLAPLSPTGTIAVNTPSDEYNSGASCSLREAITASIKNVAFGGCPAGTIALDTISLPAGTYDLGIAGSDDLNTMGDLDINPAINIAGPAGSLTISGQGAGAEINAGGVLGIYDRVFDVFTNMTVTFVNLTVTGGRTSDSSAPAANGGGIRNAGTLTLDDVIVSLNTAGAGNPGGAGGGISNTSNLTLTDSIVSINTAGRGAGGSPGGSHGGEGGGIYSNGGILTISNSSILENTAGEGEDHTTSGRGGNGGGVSTNSGTTTITNSTIKGNTAGAGGAVTTSGSGGRGGGCYLSGTTTITGSTISGNSAGSSSSTSGGDGGGIYANGTVTLLNSTVSGNQSGSSSGEYGSAGDGGGLVSSGLVILRYSTIYNNQTGSAYSGGSGGGISGEGDHYLSLGATILAGNSTPGGSHPDCYSFGSVISEDYNLVGDPTGCTFDAPTTHSFMGVIRLQHCRVWQQRWFDPDA